MSDPSATPLLLPAVTLTVSADQSCACGAYADWSCDGCGAQVCDACLVSFPLEVFATREYPAVLLCDPCADAEESERTTERFDQADPDARYEELREGGWL